LGLNRFPPELFRESEFRTCVLYTFFFALFLCFFPFLRQFLQIMESLEIKTPSPAKTDADDTSSRRTIVLGGPGDSTRPRPCRYRGITRNCAGAGVQSPGPPRTMVRRELASASVFAGEGVLISRDSMICKKCRKKGKKQRKRAKKMMCSRRCHWCPQWRRHGVTSRCPCIERSRDQCPSPASGRRRSTA
jgi:hypothetical protein